MSKLRARLNAAMEPRLVFRAPVWGNPRAMTAALRDVRKTFSSGEGAVPAKDVLQAALRRFAMTQTVASFTELKHLCYGVSVPVGENQWRLIDREPLLQKLLGLVQRRTGQAKQYRRCYQGLLNAYFGFDKQTAASSGLANWTQLRAYLDQSLGPIAEATTRSGLALDWLQTLLAHRNLLSDDPCSQYARELRQGRTDEFRSLCAALGIASASWVWDEALMAYVRAVCEVTDDGQFRRDMAGVLDLVNGRAELKLPQLLCTQATALAVARYARCGDRPEQADLRDTSLRLIGNPWVNRTAWDSHVRFEPAREMVEAWIKRRLIKDFFELLAHDGGADLRRLNYWLKWEPQISDMWFILGFDASNNRSKAFEELRQRMAGRRRWLDDPNWQNNAFVMRIGPLLVIEFGVTGNACYAFAAADFKGDLDKPQQNIHLLKQRAGATRLSHSHSWESRFDYELRKLIQSVPKSKGELPLRPLTRPEQAGVTVITRSSSGLPPGTLAARPAAPAAGAPNQPVRAMPSTTSAGSSALTDAQLRVIIDRCRQHGLDWEDNRGKHGAFWVLIDDRRMHPGLSALLDNFGFAYSVGKGFWIKDKA